MFSMYFPPPFRRGSVFIIWLKQPSKKSSMLFCPVLAVEMTIFRSYWFSCISNWREIQFSVLKIGVRWDIPSLYKTG